MNKLINFGASKPKEKCVLRREFSIKRLIVRKKDAHLQEPSTVEGKKGEHSLLTPKNIIVQESYCYRTTGNKIYF